MQAEPSGATKQPPSLGPSRLRAASNFFSVGQKGPGAQPRALRVPALSHPCPSSTHSQREARRCLTSPQSHPISQSTGRVGMPVPGPQGEPSYTCSNTCPMATVMVTANTYRAQIHARHWVGTSLQGDVYKELK